MEEALGSKWEGVRANAAKVLGLWGGRQSVEALRAALESSMEKEAGWALRSVLVRALCRCADPVDDATWMLDCYFDASLQGLKRAAQSEFWPFVRAVPRDVLRQRIELEQHSPSTTHREAAERALRWMESAS